MAESQNPAKKVDIEAVMSREEAMFGRRDIYSTYDTITAGNVVAAVNYAMSFHMLNFEEEDYLYWRRRGMSPVLLRQKERNDFVNNKVVENHPDTIVSFKNGFMLPQPAFYVAKDNDRQDDVKKLNEYMVRSGKPAADNKAVDWFHTTGKGVIYCEPTDDPEVPLKAYALDPRSAFVVYSMRPGNEPVMGINMVMVEGRAHFDVYTKDAVYRLVGGAVGPIMTDIPLEEVSAISVESVEPNWIGEIPIIEYRYNSVNMGAFEGVLTICTALDTISSNRVDGVEQFIQSLIVTYNVEFDEGVTASKIRQLGYVPLKSTNDSKGDIKILSEELNQTQTQTLADNLYDQMLTICMMPSNRKGGASTSDTGAASLYRDGWVQAETCASNTQDLFRESNRYFDRILCKVLSMRGLLDITPNDFELTFNRTEMANIQSKAQSLNTLLAAGMAPVLAFAKSGVSNDPISDYKQSEKWVKMRWGDPDKADELEQAATDVADADGSNEVVQVEKATDQPDDGEEA